MPRKKIDPNKPKFPVYGFVTMDAGGEGEVFWPSEQSAIDGADENEIYIATYSLLSVRKMRKTFEEIS